MKIQKYLIFTSLIFALSNHKKTTQNKEIDNSEALFQLITAEKTHVDFQNVIE